MAEIAVYVSLRQKACYRNVTFKTCLSLVKDLKSIVQ